MSRPSPVSDKSLLQSVQRKLAQKCSGSKITTTVRSGIATVSGMIKNEHERKPISRTILGIQGVTRVIDQLRVEEKKRVVHHTPPGENPYASTPKKEDAS